MIVDDRVIFQKKTSPHGTFFSKVVVSKLKTVISPRGKAQRQDKVTLPLYLQCRPLGKACGLMRSQVTGKELLSRLGAEASSLASRRLGIETN